MGYLINPIGFRVGHTASWTDLWFTRKQAYPEFLHFVLKIRLFLNDSFLAMPGEEDADYTSDVYKYRLSLFRSSTLYSHFQIVFNLNLIYVFLFVYPGYFWDTFSESFRLRRRRYSNVLFKSLSWDRFSKKKHLLGDALFFNRRHYRKALGFAEYSYPADFLEDSAESRVHDLRNFLKYQRQLRSKSQGNFGKYHRNWQRKRSFFGRPALWASFIKHQPLKDKRWMVYNSIIKSFLWDFKAGFHFFLLFLIFFKPFAILNNIKALFYKSFEQRRFLTKPLRQRPGVSVREVSPVNLKFLPLVLFFSSTFFYILIGDRLFLRALGLFKEP